jgi:hypothetical protein
VHRVGGVHAHMLDPSSCGHDLGLPWAMMARERCGCSAPVRGDGCTAGVILAGYVGHHLSVCGMHQG